MLNVGPWFLFVSSEINILQILKALAFFKYGALRMKSQCVHNAQSLSEKRRSFLEGVWETLLGGNENSGSFISNEVTLRVWVVPWLRLLIAL